MQSMNMHVLFNAIRNHKNTVNINTFTWVDMTNKHIRQNNRPL